MAALMTLAAVVLYSGVSLTAPVAFIDVDADKDGKISQQEAMVLEGLEWSSADANQDGMLDESEYEAAMQE